MKENHELAPKELLEQRLSQESSNSPVMRAFVNQVIFELRHEHVQVKKFRRAWERVRQGYHGSHAMQCRQATQDAREIFKAYYIVRQTREPDPFVDVTFDSFREMLRDLKEIKKAKRKAEA